MKSENNIYDETQKKHNKQPIGYGAQLAALETDYGGSFSGAINARRMSGRKY